MKFWERWQGRGQAKNTYLIVGLGNPGAKYKHSRHNMGFRVIARLLEHYGVLAGKTRGRALVAEAREGAARLILAMPQTYMNLSGESVAELMRLYGVAPEKLLVIYDDIDLQPGALRLRPRGSAGTHNGMRSIVACLGTQDFPRLRVGVGKPAPEVDLADYVLADCPPWDREAVERALDRAAETAIKIPRDGLEKTLSSMQP